MHSPTTLYLFLNMLLLGIVHIERVRQDGLQSACLHGRVPVVGARHRAVDERVAAEVACCCVTFRGY